MNIEPETRASLLLRLRDLNDATAWSQFVRLYLPMVYHYLRRRGMQDADAADVGQEVLKSVAAAMPGFHYDAARGNFRGWLLTVVRSRTSDWLRQKSRRELVAGDSAIAGQRQQQEADEAIEEERRQWEADYQHALFECAAARVQPQVNATTWEAFWQTTVAGQPAAEVAEATGLTTGAVYVARSRVTARLRQEIQQIEQSEEA